MYLVFVIMLAMHSTSAQSILPGGVQYFSYVGRLEDTEHGVFGRVYADFHSIYIANFFFQGNCPEPVFVASSTSRKPDKEQFVYLPYFGQFYDRDTKYLKNELINNAKIHLHLASIFDYIGEIIWFGLWCDRGKFFMGTIQFQHHIGRLVGEGFSGDVYTDSDGFILIKNYSLPAAEENFKFVAVSESGFKSEGIQQDLYAPSATKTYYVEMLDNFNFSDVTLVQVEDAAGKIITITQPPASHNFTNVAKRNVKDAVDHVLATTERHATNNATGITEGYVEEAADNVLATTQHLSSNNFTDATKGHMKDAAGKMIAITQHSSSNNSTDVTKRKMEDAPDNVGATTQRHSSNNFTDVIQVDVGDASDNVRATTQRKLEDQEDTGSWWDFISSPFYFLSGFSSKMWR